MMRERTDTVVEAIELHKTYVLPRERLFRPAETIQAVAGVSFSVARGEAFGIVGESGCGKSTLARLIMGLETPEGGSVSILGQQIGALSGDDLRRLRRHFQMVFQDPFGSLDPRHRVRRIVAEPLGVLAERLGPEEQRARVTEVLEAVGLSPGDLDKYPHEFSGGQRQRIAIARAIITRPALIVADEPVSALDLSVQAQVLNLLQDLRAQFGLTFVLISHDLAVVEYICDRVAVMQAGAFIECGPTARIFEAPAHPYTRALLDAIPSLPT